MMKMTETRMTLPLLLLLMLLLMAMVVLVMLLPPLLLIMGMVTTLCSACRSGTMGMGLA